MLFVRNYRINIVVKYYEVCMHCPHPLKPLLFQLLIKKPSHLWLLLFGVLLQTSLI